jgi:hypothetical protein
LIAAGTLPQAMIGGYREQLGEVVGNYALYRHFDAAGKLIYVGKTNNYARRSDEHKDKEWWKDVASSQVEWFPSEKAVLAAEKAAILAEHPRENWIHNTENPDGPCVVRGRWRSVGLSVRRSLPGTRREGPRAACGVWLLPWPLVPVV